MNNTISPVSQTKRAIAELQGLRHVVVTGGDTTTPAVLAGVVSNNIDPLLFSVVAIDGDAAALADSVVDITSNCTLSSKSQVITAITLATTDPVEITSTAHGLATGQTIRNIAAIVGTVELNGTSWVVDVVDADNYTLRGSNSANYTAYTSGGTYAAPQRTIEFDADFKACRLMVWLYMQPGV